MVAIHLLFAMKVAVFSAKAFDRTFFKAAPQAAAHDVTFLDARLAEETVALADGFPCVCVFVNGKISAALILNLNLKSYNDRG